MNSNKNKQIFTLNWHNISRIQTTSKGKKRIGKLPVAGDGE